MCPSIATAKSGSGEIAVQTAKRVGSSTRFGAVRRDQPAEPGHAERQERHAAEERAGRRARQALRVRRDPHRQVLGLEPGQEDGEDERGDPKRQSDAKQPVDEDIGGEHDHADSDDEEDDTSSA
jgi:hypothetical protein